MFKFLFQNKIKIVLIILLLSPLFININNSRAASTYYVRQDGTASDKSTATDPTSASTSMSPTTFNGETFSADDIIYFSSRGGNFTTSITISSGGSGVGNEITYAGESGFEGVWTSNFVKITASNVILNDLTVNSFTNSSFEFGDAASVYTNITTNNLSSSNSSNQSFQHLDGVTVVHNDAYASDADNEGVSLHNDTGVVDPTVTFNGLIIEDCYTGINWVGAPTLKVYDFHISGATTSGFSIEPSNSGGTHVFERGTIIENPDIEKRAIDCSNGSFSFKNVIFKNLTGGAQGDFYLLLRSGLTAGEVVNCTFIGDGVRSTTAIFNQVSGGIYKNNYFVDAGTQAYWGTGGTIDYNGYYNSGTVRGTNTTTGDPNFDSDGKIQSGSSLAVGAGIGPGSDSDVPTEDIDGDTRSGATTDLGADEFTIASFTGNFNGVSNANISKINGVSISSVSKLNGVQ